MFKGQLVCLVFVDVVALVSSYFRRSRKEEFLAVLL
jgi:hypothetical protein